MRSAALRLTALQMAQRQRATLRAPSDIAEIILELPFRTFVIDTVVRCGAQSGFAFIQIWHFYYSNESSR
jgi:hypothetical protein